MPRLHSGAMVEKPETTNPTLSPIQEVVWQQPQGTHLINIHKILTTETHKKTLLLEFKQRYDVEPQTSPMKKTSHQVSGSSKEPLLEKQTARTPVHCLSDSNKRQPELQRNETNMTANDIGDDNISPLKITTSQIEERLVRVDIIEEL